MNKTSLDLLSPEELLLYKEFLSKHNTEHRTGAKYCIKEKETYDHKSKAVSITIELIVSDERGLSASVCTPPSHDDYDLKVVNGRWFFYIQTGNYRKGKSYDSKGTPVTKLTVAKLRFEKVVELDAPHLYDFENREYMQPYGWGHYYQKGDESKEAFMFYMINGAEYRVSLSDPYRRIYPMPDGIEYIEK